MHISFEINSCLNKAIENVLLLKMPLSKERNDFDIANRLISPDNNSDMISEKDVVSEKDSL